MLPDPHIFTLESQATPNCDVVDLPTTTTPFQHQLYHHSRPTQHRTCVFNSGRSVLIALIIPGTDALHISSVFSAVTISDNFSILYSVCRCNIQRYCSALFSHIPESLIVLIPCLFNALYVPRAFIHRLSLLCLPFSHFNIHPSQIWT